MGYGWIIYIIDIGKGYKWERFFFRKVIVKYVLVYYYIRGLL